MGHTLRPFRLILLACLLAPACSGSDPEPATSDPTENETTTDDETGNNDGDGSPGGTADPTIDEEEAARRAVCSNQRLDDQETGIDCGGLCPPCTEPGTPCFTDLDCAEGLLCGLEDKLCDPVTCENNVLDPLETDIDCGGSFCVTPCQEGQLCEEDDGLGNLVAADVNCDDGNGGLTVCDPESGRCLAASCEDGYVNGDEPDVDCGAVCSNPCEIGQICDQVEDCENDFYYLANVGDAGPFGASGNYKSGRFILARLDPFGVIPTYEAQMADAVSAECDARFADPSVHSCDTQVIVPVVLFRHRCDETSETCALAPGELLEFPCDRDPTTESCPDNDLTFGACKYDDDCSRNKTHFGFPLIYECVADGTDPDGSTRGACSNTGVADTSVAPVVQACGGARDTHMRPMIADERAVPAEPNPPYDPAIPLHTYSNFPSFDGYDIMDEIVMNTWGPYGNTASNGDTRHTLPKNPYSTPAEGTFQDDERIPFDYHEDYHGASFAFCGADGELSDPGLFRLRVGEYDGGGGNEIHLIYESYFQDRGTYDDYGWETLPFPQSFCDAVIQYNQENAYDGNSSDIPTRVECDSELYIP